MNIKAWAENVLLYTVGGFFTALGISIAAVTEFQILRVAHTSPDVAPWTVPAEALSALALGVLAARIFWPWNRRKLAHAIRVPAGVRIIWQVRPQDVVFPLACLVLLLGCVAIYVLPNVAHALDVRSTYTLVAGGVYLLSTGWAVRRAGRQRCVRYFSQTGVGRLPVLMAGIVEQPLSEAE